MALVQEESEDTSLDTLLAKATNPLNRDVDERTLESLCQAVVREQDGCQTALRFVAHKIQSPQEREALKTLTVLELMVSKSGTKLTEEIGKFRFLNELIKVVSPKYLAHRSAPKVKQKIVELMYLWSIEIKEEPKIFEAYQMLKKQGIVAEDPVHILHNYRPPTPPPPRPKDEVFDDEEKSKTLRKLLQSRNPEDLQAANKLIKTMVKEVDQRMNLKARCCSELETVRNNASVLSDMLVHYVAGETSQEELELITELYDSCERLRPKLFRLAGEMEEKESVLDEILEANDELTKVITEYKVKMGMSTSADEVSQPVGAIASQSSLLDLVSPTQEAITDVSLLSDHIVSLNATESNDSIKSATKSDSAAGSALDELSHLFGAPSATSTGVPGHSCNGSPFVLREPVMSVPLTPLSSNAGKGKVHGQVPAIKESASSLDELEALLRQSMPLSGEGGRKSDFYGISKVPLNQIKKAQNESLNETVAGNRSFGSICTSPSKSMSADTLPLPLTDIFVPLETITPSTLPPVPLTEKNGLKVILNFGQNTPRADVTVMVITSINTSPSAVSHINFQAAVPKNMRVKLQPPSATCLPSFSPFLPPAAITQVMLVARLASGDADKVRFKYKLTYTTNEEEFTDIGVIEHLFESHQR